MMVCKGFMLSLRNRLRRGPHDVYAALRTLLSANYFAEERETRSSYHHLQFTFEAYMHDQLPELTLERYCELMKLRETAHPDSFVPITSDDLSNWIERVKERVQADCMTRNF